MKVLKLLESYGMLDHVPQLTPKRKGTKSLAHNVSTELVHLHHQRKLTKICQIGITMTSMLWYDMVAKGKT